MISQKFLLEIRESLVQIRDNMIRKKELKQQKKLKEEENQKNIETIEENLRNLENEKSILLFKSDDIEYQKILNDIQIKNMKKNREEQIKIKNLTNFMVFFEESLGL